MKKIILISLFISIVMLLTIISIGGVSASTSTELNNDIFFAFNMNGTKGLSDLTGNMINATIFSPTASLINITGKNGLGLTSNGANNNAFEINYSSAVETNNFTFSIWLNTASQGYFSDAETTGQYRMRTIGGDWYYESGATSGYSNLGINIQDSTWHNLVVVSNATKTCLWIDGNNGSCYNSGIVSTGNDWHLFNSYNGAAGFSGSLDEAYYFTRPLNDTEVEFLYNSGTGNFYPFQDPPQNISVTAYNNSDFLINNYSLVLNGTLYSTSNGVITTNFILDLADVNTYDYIILNAIDNNSLKYRNTSFNFQLSNNATKIFHLAYQENIITNLNWFDIEQTEQNQNIGLVFIILLIALNLYFAYRNHTILFIFTSLFMLITGFIFLFNDWTRIFSLFLIFYSLIMLFVSTKKQ